MQIQNIKKIRSKQRVKTLRTPGLGQIGRISNDYMPGIQWEHKQQCGMSMVVVQMLIKMQLDLEEFDHLHCAILILSSISLNMIEELKLCTMSNWFLPCCLLHVFVCVFAGGCWIGCHNPLENNVFLPQSRR